jgi:hypothetical protein
VAAAAPSYLVRPSPLRAAHVWSVEDACLIRRGGARDRAWSLGALTRMTLSRQANRYGPDIRLVQLRFGRRAVAFSSQSWAAVGRPEDHTRAFAAFVRALAAAAAAEAPSARFEVGGRWAVPGSVYWIAALLGAAIAALAAVAVAAGEAALGLELGARMLFVLILLLAAAPWLPGAAARRFDPRDIPADLAPRF